MPLDWKEIANRARTFSKEWKHVESEEWAILSVKG